MSKGEETRRAILGQALDMSSEVGLEGLTVGNLARRMCMSKSGLYAHFGSKEDLQSQVLDTAAERFVDAVLARAFKHPRGIPRVRALLGHWLDWSTDGLSGGCPFIAASTEFDDRAGPVRDRLVAHLRDATETIGHAAQIAVDEGQFRGDLDVEQFAFDFWAILAAYHHFHRLMGIRDARGRADRALDQLIHNAGGH